MDLALYYKLQSGRQDLLAVQVYQDQANLTASQASQAYYDPFKPISVKLLMLDHLNHYIYYPACAWLDVNVIHVSDRLTFISPDAISLAHVAVAALGAKTLLSESLTSRRLGVLLFELRSMLDSYDGLVARARSGTKAMAQVSGSWGYWMDGICDAVGTCFFFVACWILLQRRQQHLRQHQSDANIQMEEVKVNSEEDLFAISVSPMEESKPFLESNNNGSNSNSSNSNNSQQQLFRMATITMLALLAQQFLASLFWNRYMQGFHQLLEVPYR